MSLYKTDSRDCFQKFDTILGIMLNVESSLYVPSIGYIEHWRFPAYPCNYPYLTKLHPAHFNLDYLCPYHGHPQTSRVIQDNKQCNPSSLYCTRRPTSILPVIKAVGYDSYFIQALLNNNLLHKARQPEEGLKAPMLAVLLSHIIGNRLIPWDAD